MNNSIFLPNFIHPLDVFLPLFSTHE